MTNKNSALKACSCLQCSASSEISQGFQTRNSQNLKLVSLENIISRAESHFFGILSLKSVDMTLLKLFE